MKKNEYPSLNLLFRIGLAALVVAVAGFLAYHTLWKKEENPRIILISIDTCRPDYLGCYGCSRGTTPNIDGVAQEGILFENVVTTVPLTIPAHCTMLTGTSPLRHGVRANGGYRLGPHSITIPEILKLRGYTTAAIVSAFVMQSRFGFDQGFDEYDDDLESATDSKILYERRAEEISRLAVEWLNRHAHESFFLFLHYFDPHDEYIPPEPFATRYADDLYAGEIAYTDHAIGSVLEELKALGIYDDALIIITGDHGESLGQHGEETHGFFIYNSTLSVPLIFKPPGSRDSSRVKEMVGVIDLMPTVLSYLDLPVPDSVEGEDLSAWLDGSGGGEMKRFYYCESLFPSTLGCRSLRGIVSEEWKFIAGAGSELYRLRPDPGEESNLSAAESEVVNRMQGVLNEMLEEEKNLGDRTRVIQEDEESRRRLEGIGYISGGVAMEDTGDGDDPREYVTLFNKVVRMLLLQGKGETSEVKTLCREILDERPGMGFVHGIQALISQEEGDFAGALHHYTEASKDEYGSDIEKSNAHFTLARFLVGQGVRDQAILHYRKALELNPGWAVAHCGLGIALAGAGESVEAREQLATAIRIEPNLPEAHYYLGQELYKAGRAGEAISAYRKFLRLEPEQPEPARAALAWLLATNPRHRNPRQAVELAQQNCQATGRDDPFYLLTLAEAYFAAGRRDDAIFTAEEALELARSRGLGRMEDNIKKRLGIYRR